MAQDLDGLLGDFNETSPPYRVLDALLKVAPGSPPIEVWGSLGEAATALKVDPDHVDRAREIARGGEAQSALWMLQGLDEGDDVVSILSGLGSAVRLYLADHADPSVDLTRKKQAEDAVKKCLGIAWAVDRLFGGTPEQKVETLVGLEAGRALVAFFATTEIALPFLADTSDSGAGLLDQLLDENLETELEKLSGSVGADRIRGATALLPLLSPHLRAAITANEKRLDKLVEQMQKRLPALMAATGHVGEVAAHGVDALPMYHLLGARLLAEAALSQAADPERFPLPVDEDTERQLAEAKAAAEAARVEAEEAAQAALSAEKAKLAEEAERQRLALEQEREAAAAERARAEARVAEALAAAAAAEAAANAARAQAEAAQTAAEAELARQRAAAAEAEQADALKVARTITSELPPEPVEPKPPERPKPVVTPEPVEPVAAPPPKPPEPIVVHPPKPQAPEPKRAAEPAAAKGGSKLKWAVGCVVLLGLIACCGTIGAGALSGVIYSTTGIEMPQIAPPKKSKRR